MPTYLQTAKRLLERVADIITECTNPDVLHELACELHELAECATERYEDATNGWNDDEEEGEP